MATSKKFSELPAASSVGNGDLFAIAHEDALAETGYVSQKLTAAQAGQKVNGDTEYPTSLPSFPANGQNPFAALEKLNSDIIGLYPVNIASGSIATFSTSLALPLVAMSAEIVAQQASGIPTPSNPLPITGVSSVGLTHTGKNLFDPVVYNSFLQSDGKYRGAANSIVAVRTNVGGYIGKQLTFSVYADLTVSPTPTNVKVAAIINGATTYGSDINSGTAGYSSVIFTPQSENDTVLITFGSAGGNSYTFYDIQLEASSARTTYEPYNAETKTIALGQTVYGGVLDVINGELVITYGIVDLGTLDWVSEDSAVSGLVRVNVNQVVPLGAKYLQIPICTCFEGVYTRNYNAFSNNEIAFSNSEIAPFLRARSTEFIGKTSEQIKAFMSGVQLAYELSTPIEITGLTPANFTTFVGENNIFSDSGDISVSFKQGIQEYIDAKIAETQALIL